MKWLPILRVSSVLLFLAALLLVGMTMRTMDDSRRWVSDAGKALMGFSLAERTLQVDLLDARAGLLRNYDPVNADILALRDHLGALEHLPKDESAQVALNRLRAIVERQELLVERFKSDNALLQNSLSLFRANEGLRRGSHEALTSRILSLTLDTSQQTVAEARATLAATPTPAPGTADAQLASHARLLVTILPEIDDTLRTIRAMRVEEQAGQLQAILRSDSTHRADVIRELQAVIAITTLLLLGSVITLIILQRWRTQELEAQAANERLSAAMALPLIETGSATFAERVRTAVERLAPHIGAKTLQLSIPGLPNFPQISWPDEGLDAQWLTRFVNAADNDQCWVGGKIVVSRRRSRKAGVFDNAMRNADVEDLVLLRSADPFQVLIGFELARGSAAERWNHAASVESAIVVIAHGARREAMQIERGRLERSLARARRMETIGAMASGVAHNFNNIIGAIGGFAEMGQERTRAGSGARNSFDEIQGAVYRARDLVDDILGFARQRSSAKQPLNLVEVLHGAIRLLVASSRDAKAFRVEPGAASLLVRAGVSDLEQAIINICNNGAFASEGKTVSIKATRVHLAGERQQSHGKLEPGDYAIIAISDQGPGVPDIAFPRLFEPFYTTKAVGTGLGLSTAWEIIQDHGGTIDVRNRATGGACFSIWLPESPMKPGLAVGDGAPILLVSEAPALAAEEELLAEIGYEPLGFVVSTPVEVLREAAMSCEAVLISSPRRGIAEGLVRDLGPHLQGRFLMVATLGNLISIPSVVATRLDFPLLRTQLSKTLFGRVRRDARDAGIVIAPLKEAQRAQEAFTEINS